jgi:putative DNA primase/helicase
MTFTEVTDPAEKDQAISNSLPTSNGNGNGSHGETAGQAPAVEEADSPPEQEQKEEEALSQPEEEEERDLTEEFCEICFRELFSNGVGWIEAGGHYFTWNTTHYQEVPMPQLRKLVATYARSFTRPKFDERGNEIGYVRPFAKPGFIGPAITWLTALISIPPDRLNPSGLVNCTNGVLRIQWKRSRPIVELEPHDPEQHFLVGQPHVAFDPDADPTHVERLLECVDPTGRDLLFEVLGAAIDLRGLSENGGARVPALLQIGDGENGKDTVNLCGERVLGSAGVATVSLKNWRQHDEGSGSGRFNIYQLVGARLCLSSENSQFFKLDELQSLKAAITNDPIYVEEKGIQGFRYQPWCAFIWNLNKEPLIDGAQAAVLTRYGVIRYPFTYARNPKGDQKKADPRFKHDPKWVQTNVLPAFLNLMVAGLERAATQGFSLEKVETTLHAIRKGTSHLWQFAEDANYEKGTPDDYVLVRDVWVDLIRWYRDNGWLEDSSYIPTTGNNTSHMHIRFYQSDDGDKPVKALKDVSKRLQVLFPGSQISRDPGKTRAAILRGVRKQHAQDLSPSVLQRNSGGCKSSASNNATSSGSEKAA